MSAPVPPPATLAAGRPTATAAPRSVATPAEPPRLTAAGGLAERGERLFVVKGCAVCHGTGAEGNVVGPQLAPLVLSLDTVQIRVRSPAHPRMPTYTPNDLTDAELVDIYAYLGSL